jgi:hypothetical protein
LEHKKKKSNSICICGVGVGILLGVCKILFEIPIAYLLIPPYLFLAFITLISSEDFVNIGWDSAGVTTVQLQFLLC